MFGALDFPGGSDGKVSAYNEGDLGLIHGSERSSGEGNGNLLQYSCLGLYRQVQVQSMWLQRVGHDFTFTLTFGVFETWSFCTDWVITNVSVKFPSWNLVVLS